jgi:high-affinity iron transporter
MLPTFVIGLREGLEAALIVGIVAAFLRQRGRPDLLRLALYGVAAAVVICAAIGVTLEIVSQNLPQRQQEGLETVIGAVAVAMVTYMVVWMKRHSRDLRAQLEGAAANAVDSGSGMALVLMAFLAVLREGFETAVFLIAAFNESDSGASAGFGAALGIAVAVLLGYGIYRGGVRINLSKFFRFTGLVLVLVAAGLVVTALHTAHEAGWLNSGQQRTLDLTSITRPGSVQSSLLTGMLGVQDRPVRIELIGWLVYLIPLGTYVLWPAGRALGIRTVRRAAAGVAATAAATAVVLMIAAPAVSRGAADVASADGNFAVSAVTADAATLTIQSSSAPAGQFQGKLTASTAHLGIEAREYSAATDGAAAKAGPATATLAEIAARNGGRLPLGAVAAGTPTDTVVPLTYRSRTDVSWWIEPSTGRLLDVQWSVSTTTNASFTADQVTAIGSPASTTGQLGNAVSAARTSSIKAQLNDRSEQRSLRAWALGLAVIAVVALLVALGYGRRLRSASRSHDDHQGPGAKLLVG